MPTRGMKGVVQKMIEFPPDQCAAVEKFAEGRGESFKAVVLHALRRHLKYPPPPPAPEPVEPLPDSPAVAPAGGSGRKGRRPRKAIQGGVAVRPHRLRLVAQRRAPTPVHHAEGARRGRDAGDVRRGGEGAAEGPQRQAARRNCGKFTTVGFGPRP